MSGEPTRHAVRTTSALASVGWSKLESITTDASANKELPFDQGTPQLVATGSQCWLHSTSGYTSLSLSTICRISWRLFKGERYAATNSCAWSSFVEVGGRDLGDARLTMAGLRLWFRAFLDVAKTTYEPLQHVLPKCPKPCRSEQLIPGRVPATEYRSHHLATHPIC